MEENLLKTLARIAAIGGISLGVLLIFFRDFIRKNMFPKFKDVKLASSFFRLIVVMVWSLAIAGIGTWVFSPVFSKKIVETFSIPNTEFSGDMYFATTQFILNQYRQIHGKPLDDEVLKDEIERGVNLSKGGIYDKALLRFQKIVEQMKSPAVYNNLGGLYAVTKNYDDAREAYSKAIEQNPEYQPVHLNLGLLEEQQGWGTKAIEHFKKAAVLENSSQRIYRIMEGIKRGLIEEEPNNETQSANPFPPFDSSVKGVIENGSDTDYFQIKNSNRERDILKVELQLPNPTTLRPRIDIYNENKQRLGGTTDDAGDVSPGQNIEYSFSAQPDSNYYISVGGLSKTRGAYRLKITPLQAYDAFEPNDDVLKFTRLRYGHSKVHANIMDRFDQDYFSVPLSYDPGSHRQAMTITLHNRSTTLRPQIGIYYGKHKQFLGGTTDVSGKVTPGQNIAYSWVARRDKRYFVHVRSLSDTHGAYILTIGKSEELSSK